MIPRKEREVDKAICDAATKGPWGNMGYFEGEEHGPHIEALDDRTVAVCSCDVAEHEANGKFIAHARDRLPLYIAAADATEARIAVLDGLAEKADAEAATWEERGERWAASDRRNAAELWRRAAKIMRGDT